ncbi:MAG TPA: 50S ribosomal protein L19 [Candidatus Portnoybacteria bacterium]|nr:50S ribosomal protein L19 [Candidatus Portnoybacteria bacterium]HNU96743.1 50S ribosomal protein L19 [Candidatus Portnoybacteria bacterium]HOZ16525.1 50S ribosomal protein L19 [Candidatus Portnoybacteria bacterium]HPH52284.1 50S ribosomal protein L19 [Candidatus Portnoybacteria bacterium]HPM28630.1 50S ribosomal protein L19 [Candidatus Portnoybacteria bacterium]
MTNKLDKFKEKFTKKDNPEIKIGDIVKVHLKLAEKTKAGGDKIQVFEGLVIAKKHGKGMDGTFTVRKIAEGIGAEKIFPVHCPTISKIEIVKHSKVRRAKLYYMRGRLGKKARMSALKGTNLAETSSEDESASKTEK